MTFSIIARDPTTGAFGVATATGGPAVGQLVPHARAGMGALATQGFTNPLYAYDGLAALEAGRSAQEIVAELTGADSGRERRQLIVIDATGKSAGWTGGELEGSCAMVLETGFAVAGNLLSNDQVVPAMAAAFDALSGRLEDRLLAAMEAGHAAGGDSRGILSAALKTYTDQLYPAIDVRVDFSDTPLSDLSRTLDRVRTGGYADFFAQLPRR